MPRLRSCALLATLAAFLAFTGSAAASSPPSVFTVYKHRTSSQMVVASTGQTTTDMSGAAMGDTQIIYGTVARTPGGKPIGHYRGVAMLLGSAGSSSPMMRWFHAKISLPGGAIFLDDIQDSPNMAAMAAGAASPHWTYAVVGGTGRYRGVTGECDSVVTGRGTYFKDTFRLVYPR
ncbi:MAG: hypothetical protein ACR2J9_11435 [Gaiellales bacterium]